jgi:hypothetical protein
MHLPAQHSTAQHSILTELGVNQVNTAVLNISSTFGTVGPRPTRNYYYFFINITTAVRVGTAVVPELKYYKYES